MRVLKQIFYGTGVLALLAGAAFAIYSIAVTPEAPTCSDGTQNQNETGVDCGGECVACELVNAELVVGDVRFLPAGDGRITLLVRVENPVSYRAALGYRIDILGSFGGVIGTVGGKTEVEPKSERYIAHPGIPFDPGDASAAEFQVTTLDWEPPEPTRLLLIEARNVETFHTGNSVRVTGQVANDSSEIVETVKITALLLGGDGEIINASTAEVRNLGISREAPFTIFFPDTPEAESVPDPLRTRILLEVMR